MLRLDPWAVSSSTEEATGYHEDMEGYDPGDAKAGCRNRGNLPGTS